MIMGIGPLLDGNRISHIVTGTRRRPMVSHSSLVSDASGAQLPSLSSPAARVDAVVVPTSRSASHIRGAARLSSRLGAPLVALCSGEARGAEVTSVVAELPGCAALVVDVPRSYRNDFLPVRTTAARFREASHGRVSDLGTKRNIGLLLARLLGWRKVIFLDDDIGEEAAGRPVSIPSDTAYRLAAQLESHQIAGLTCHTFPDNSVVYHARRLAGFAQGNFVSGAALGVNCSDQPFPFFPNIYNEDWFFFSSSAAARRLCSVGRAVQAEYDPYGSPDRARREEFGDLLAEGLYALFERQPQEMDYRHRIGAADTRYWARFIEARRAVLDRTRKRLARKVERDSRDRPTRLAAIRSLNAAGDQLSLLTPDLCADFLDAWDKDRTDWQEATQRIRPVGHVDAAMQELELDQWDAIRFGVATARSGAFR